MLSLTSAIRRRLRRPVRPAVTPAAPVGLPHLEPHAYGVGPGSCYACCGAGIQMIVYGPDVTTYEGLCRRCIDLILGDDESVQRLADAGSTWVVLAEPVSAPECVEALAFALREHRLPFFARSAV